LPCHINNFGVKGRVVIPDSLIAKLVVLPISSCLGSFISKNRANIIQLYRLGQIMHPMFQVGSAHWRRALWSQGYFISPSIFKGIHLLLYNICFFAYTAGEKPGVLKGRDINALIAIELADINHFLLYIAPVGLLPG
jgi:hypothetical protein